MAWLPVNFIHDFEFSSFEKPAFLLLSHCIGVLELSRLRLFTKCNASSDENPSPKEALYFVNKRSRDNSRTPFQWNSTKNAGFSKDENVKAWIELTGSHEKVNAKSQINNEDSIFAHYKNMIELRQNGKYSDCLTFGEFIPVDLENDEIIAYIRKYENQKVLCINNFSDKNQKVELSEIAKSISEKEIKLTDILINNYENIENDGKVLVLEGYQSLLVEFQIL